MNRLRQILRRCRYADMYTRRYENTHARVSMMMLHVCGTQLPPEAVRDRVLKARNPALWSKFERDKLAYTNARAVLNSVAFFFRDQLGGRFDVAHADGLTWTLSTPAVNLPSRSTMTLRLWFPYNNPLSEKPPIWHLSSNGYGVHRIDSVQGKLLDILPVADKWLTECKERNEYTARQEAKSLALHPWRDGVADRLDRILRSLQEDGRLVYGSRNSLWLFEPGDRGAVRFGVNITYPHDATEVVVTLQPHNGGAHRLFRVKQTHSDAAIIDLLVPHLKTA